MLGGGLRPECFGRDHRHCVLIYGIYRAISSSFIEPRQYWFGSAIELYVPHSGTQVVRKRKQQRFDLHCSACLDVMGSVRDVSD